MLPLSDWKKYGWQYGFIFVADVLSSTYKDRLAEEVNDKLTEQGQVTIAELTKTYDLPADFLTEVCV